MAQPARANYCIPTYLINLDRATDRLAHMELILSDLSLPFERVSAIDGRNIKFPTTNFAERTYTIFHGRRRNPAEIGCYLSHVECARRLLASSAEHALILEDDLYISTDIRDLIQAAIEAGADWDILRLSTVNNGRKFPFRNITPIRSLAISLTREKGSGAYIINRRAAKWFVDKLLPMRLPFDLAFDLEHLAGLKAAFVFPVPISQDMGVMSQIQGHRRAFHLSRWHYAIVQPYRAWLEITRLFCRLSRLLVLRTRQTTDQTVKAYDGTLVGDDRYLADMAVPSDHGSHTPLQRGRR